MSDWFENYALPGLMAVTLLGLALAWFGIGIAIFRWSLA